MYEDVKTHFYRTVPWEQGHAERVAVYATATAFGLGIQGEALREIRIAAELHDIGKLALYRARREVAVTEWRAHPVLGAELVPDLGPKIREAIWHHHERWDGSGYPGGLKGDTIPIGAQVIGLAEWFDVALHGAPFAAARPLESVREELRAKADIWFAGEVVEALLAVQRVIQPVGT
jgi:response regulator RpfG family c-di-GMP phosphodiesterase